MTVAASASSAVGYPSSSNALLAAQTIAALAHSYWVERHYAPGSPEQDWLRAEHELRARL